MVVGRAVTVSSVGVYAGLLGWAAGREAGLVSIPGRCTRFKEAQGGENGPCMWWQIDP